MLCYATAMRLDITHCNPWPLVTSVYNSCRVLAMMWLLCDGNEDMGKWGTGVMRTIEQCSMANGSLCSGGNNSFKHCFTAHISPQSVFDCCYITSSQSWHHGSFRRVEVELTARAAINDNVALCWSLALDSGGCCSGHGEGVRSDDHDWSTGAMQQAASVYSIKYSTLDWW